MTNEERRQECEKRLIAIVNSKGGEVLEKYITGKDKIFFKCNKEHKWKAKPLEILGGSWCPKCCYSKKRIYNVDFDFFNRDTEESFYWAGFIAADGWVIGPKMIPHRLGIELAEKDANHLNKFKKDIKSQHPIRKICKKGHKIKNTKKNCNSSNMCSLMINSIDICKSLERFGIISAKTYIYDIPEWLKNHELVRHFIRGYIGGDGCFSINNKIVVFSIYGNVYFLNSFNNIMKKNNIGLKKKRNIEKRYGKIKLAFDNLVYSDTLSIHNLYNYLYANATVFLNRKKEIAEKYKEFEKNRENIKFEKKINAEKNIEIKKNQILYLAKEYKSKSIIVKFLNCSEITLDIWLRKYKIQSEFYTLVNGYSLEDVRFAYNDLKDYSVVAKKFGISVKAAVGIVTSVNRRRVNGM